MTNPTVSWIESSSWELPFFGLPARIPWPADVAPEVANRDPFEMEHMLRAIESMGAEAGEPWVTFLRASGHLDELADAIEDSEFMRAHELLDSFESTWPGTAFELYHRGLLARIEGRERAAIAHFLAAAEKAPAVAPIWNNIGVLHTMRGEREEAAAAFQRALANAPGDRTALEGLVQVRAAVKLLRNPQDPNSMVFVDVPTFAKMAAAHVEKLRHNPEQLLAYGEQLIRDDLAPAEGFQALQQAFALRPTDRRTVFALTAALRNAGQLEAARTTITNYTEQQAGDAEAFFHLAQVCKALGDSAAETQALDRVLAIDRNAQAPLGIKFQLRAAEHDPKKEEAVARWAEEQKSWMAFVLASNIARKRGDAKPAVKWAARAFELAPENEDVLLHFTAALGEARDFQKLVSLIKPKVASGKYSKRLDWNYAQTLQQLGLTADALGVLRGAIAGEVAEEFRAAAETTIEAWSGLLAGCGAPLDVHESGFLHRPVLLTVEGGDGGIVLKAGAPLPAESAFSWRAKEGEVQVPLQQGQTGGGGEARSLGAFVVRGVRAAEGATIDCHVAAQRDGALHFRASQNGRKLKVGWTPAQR